MVPWSMWQNLNEMLGFLMPVLGFYFKFTFHEMRPLEIQIGDARIIALFTLS